MKEEELIKKIREFAKNIYEILGAGYGESVYEEAMGVEMRKDKIPYNTELNVEIIYKNEKVGTQRLDFIVDNKLVVELKAAGSITKSNQSQLKAYLKTLGLDKGLLINFPYPDREEPTIEEICVSC